MAENASTRDLKAVLADYPRSIRLSDHAEVRLRLMTAQDSDAVLAFARSLPEDDLLFLRTDITDPAVVEEWVRNIEQNRTITVLAEGGRSDGLAGYGSLHYNDANWTRHLGEIRLLVGEDYRGKGLGRRLAGAVFEIAQGLGLQKITAHMTPDQQGARATFERLGFQMEALLADFVIDRSGRTRDMLIMAHDLSNPADRSSP